MHIISLIAVFPCGNVTIFHVVEILKYGLLYVFSALNRNASSKNSFYAYMDDNLLL